MVEPEDQAGDSAVSSTDATPEEKVSTKGQAAHATDSAPATEAKPKGEVKTQRKGINPYIWASAIAALLVAELYAYGHNGEIRVCVGRKGLTDFSQLDKPRKGNIASGYPFCVESLNLGMYSRSDDVAREALDVACGRAATLLRGEKTECIRRDKDWIRQVDKKTIPPWDRRMYRRLFFIE